MNPEGVTVLPFSVSLAKHLANETWNNIKKDVKRMYKYKMEVYRTGEKESFRNEKSNNLKYFDKYKDKVNYKIKIFEKVKNRWKLIYSEI